MQKRRKKDVVWKAPGIAKERAHAQSAVSSAGGNCVARVFQTRCIILVKNENHMKNA